MSATSRAMGSPNSTRLGRSSIEQLITTYLDALAARDARRLPIATDARYTENGQELDLDDGLWATADGLGAYRHVFADTDAGEAAVMATMTENGRPILIGTRLKLFRGRIQEIETLVMRRGAGLPTWQEEGVDLLNAAGAPAPLWQAPIPAARQETRQALIETANAYFAGLENNDGKGHYPFTDDCHRIEDGVATSNNPSLGLGGSSFNPAAMSVKAQFETGFYGVVTRIDDRRFPLVDVERGIVVAFATFNHSGAKPEIVTPDGTIVPMPMFNRPLGLQIMEAFRIEGGLIRQIEAIVLVVPYGFRAGWSGGMRGA